MVRLHNIKRDDFENTFWGVSTSLWFNHCMFRCEGCWNERTWELDESLYRDNDEVVKEVLTYLDYYGMKRHLTLLGGEPFSPYNLEDALYIVRKVKEQRPKTKVLSWTGYEFHVIKKSPKLRELMKEIDVLVCGRFMKELKCQDTKKMYGSENQYIVDVKASLLKGETVYLEKGEYFLNLEEEYNKRRR